MLDVGRSSFIKTAERASFTDKKLFASLVYPVGSENRMGCLIGLKIYPKQFFPSNND